jgi:hypothetical protein
LVSRRDSSDFSRFPGFTENWLFKPETGFSKHGNSSTYELVDGTGLALTAESPMTRFSADVVLFSSGSTGNGSGFTTVFLTGTIVTTVVCDIITPVKVKIRCATDLR